MRTIKMTKTQFNKRVKEFKQQLSTQTNAYFMYNKDNAMWVAGLDDDTINHMRAHCHSHVNMGVTPSGIDWDYQKQMIEGNIRDYYLFLIFNKKGDISANIYDIESNTLYTTKDIDICTPDVLYEEWADEVLKQYVNEKPTVTYNTATSTAKEATAARNKKAKEEYRQMKLDEINAAKRQQILADDDDDDVDGHWWERRYPEYY